MTPPFAHGIVASALRTATDPILGISGQRLRLEAIDVAGAANADARSWVNRVNGQTGKEHNPAFTNYPRIASATTPNGAKCITSVNSGTQTALDFGPVMFSGHDVAWIYASTNYADSAYPVSNLLDNDAASSHLASAQTTNYDVKLLTAKVVTGYTINANGGRAPKTWTFQGSNDYSSWTTLDTRTPEAFTGVDRTFSFANSNAYLFYRLAVTATNNAEIYVTMAKLRFTGAALACTTLPTAATMYAVVKASSLTGTYLQMNMAVSYHLNWGGGTIYESWGYNPASWIVSAGTPVLAAQAWRVIRITNNAGAWAMKMDASTQLSTTGKTLGFQPMSLVCGSFVGYNAFLGGLMAAMLIIDHIPDSSEDAAIRSWYSSTYGV